MRARRVNQSIASRSARVVVEEGPLPSPLPAVKSSLRSAPGGFSILPWARREQASWCAPLPTGVSTMPRTTLGRRPTEPSGNTASMSDPGERFLNETELSDMEKANLAVAPELGHAGSTGVTGGQVELSNAQALATFLRKNWTRTKGCRMPAGVAPVPGFTDWHRTLDTYKAHVQEANTLLIKDEEQENRKWLTVFRRHAPGFAGIERELLELLFALDGRERELAWAHGLRQSYKLAAGASFVCAVHSNSYGPSRPPCTPLRSAIAPVDGLCSFLDACAVAGRINIRIPRTARTSRTRSSSNSQKTGQVSRLQR